MVAILATCTAVAVPAPALAGGCEVLDDPGDRVECQARQQARSAARAEVDRQLSTGSPSRAGVGAGGDAPVGQSAAWQEAVEDAKGVDAGEVLEPRLLAAVGGLAWFAIAVRARRRARARAAAQH